MVMNCCLTGKFSKRWPEPQRFPQFLDKMEQMMSEDYNWSAEIAELQMPVLLVFADNDSISQKHIAEFFALLGGGVKEPGWQNTQLSNSRLAIGPGYSHYKKRPYGSGEIIELDDGRRAIRWRETYTDETGNPRTKKRYQTLGSVSKSHASR